ncbi:MAG: acyl-CoA dehydrogenase family protein [Geminicoccaceae bacterium]|nr:acyl-CoA dehydrogenase family protein [Geminicoccaceae bacterium]
MQAFLNDPASNLADPPKCDGNSVLAGAARVADLAASLAPARDADGAFPAEEVRALADAGLLALPLPPTLGGYGAGGEALGSLLLLDVLRRIGRGSLPLGRLYEGHVNAWRLILRHGGPARARRLAADARAGMLFAVWNTEGSDPLRLLPEGDCYRLEGAKTFASGAGDVYRPLVTARLPDGSVRMLVVRFDAPHDDRVDLSGWRVSGMRASRSGRLDFTGLRVATDDLIGDPGDYAREPDFSAGAWRFAAVHLGGVEALAEAVRNHLRRTGRGEDPHQLARLGRMATATETARLWLNEAARLAAIDAVAPDRLIARVHLARLAVERAALDTLELAHRAVGVQAFMASSPLDRLTRDLQLYLRQPAPDRALATAAAFVLNADEPLGDLWC